MTEKTVLWVEESNQGIRLDSYISGIGGRYTRSAAAKLIDMGNITVNGQPVAKKYLVKPGDIIEIVDFEPEEIELYPRDIPLDIVFEDQDLLVVNKVQGMVVHPGPGNYDNTLVSALLSHCKGSLSGINGELRPGIVHRLDKDTSGLLVVAKNDFTHNHLSNQLKNRSIERIYETVVYGVIKEDKGRIDAPIGRHHTDRKKMAVTERNSRAAVTHFEVIARYNGYTHLRVKLETGRTHQIRVHMSYMGHPVAGDKTYAPRRKEPRLNGQCLHARTIGFVHPRTGEYLRFESELPLYFKNFLEYVGNEE